VRNLTPGEIVGQVVLARDRLNDWQRAASPTGEGEKRLVSNVVMMGMGEPLYNFEAVRDGLNVVADGDGLSISKRRITFEYVMLKGINDSLVDARALVRLVKGIPAKINLIPFNPWPDTQYECSDWEQIEKFSEVIFNAGYASPVRTPRGRDILAACGQLKSATEKLSARERLALRAMAMTD
jgi:23S rRNA (adenine2503-C2)-methyltransferase